MALLPPDRGRGASFSGAGTHESVVECPLPRVGSCTGHTGSLSQRGRLSQCKRPALQLQVAVVKVEEAVKKGGWRGIFGAMLGRKQPVKMPTNSARLMLYTLNFTSRAFAL